MLKNITLYKRSHTYYKRNFSNKNITKFSYLTDRSQFVTYDGIESKMLPIKYGVPQGSILGPLLFIIYMNDLFNISNFLFTILYADDTCVLLGGKSLENRITLMNQELHLLYICLQSNKLTLNYQKTYYMIFHRARLKLQSTTIDLQMGDCNLNKANNLKYLGVIIDDTISWVHHITYIQNKISKGIESCLKQVNTSKGKVFSPCTTPIYIPT